jgi:hypothetical protein
MDAKREGKTLSVALAVHPVDAGKTGRRNDGEWHCGLDQRTTRVATRAIELAKALSDQFHLE